MTPAGILTPEPLSNLLRRAAAEKARRDSIFDLPAKSFFRGPGGGRDLSVSVFGRRAATPLGPAAGPHTQLAQNVALGWLAGARIFELKTVQEKDRLEIPRPCIDAAQGALAFNVEWSQELTLDQSLEEYAKAWLLVHALERMDAAGLPAGAGASVFDVSVGYSLEGIRGDRVARWLDALRDARPLLARLRDGLDADVRAIGDVDAPAEVYSTITLSTFHGCPPGEVEAIVEHLIARHGVDVVVKLNPTLLGREDTDGILRGRLGYDDLRLHLPAFESEPGLDATAAMLERLAAFAAARGRRVGAKLTNTLVVENPGRFLPASERLAYLSGAPLHALAIEAARRVDGALGSDIPLSFSGGVERANVGEAVACGLLPVTGCTDLLRLGGYARMRGWVDGLEAEMERAGVHSIGALIAARGGRRRALEAYAARVLDDPRYHADRNRVVRRKVGGALALLDCMSCDKCVPVCPNDANFSFETPPAAPLPSVDLVVGAGGAVSAEAAAPFRIDLPRQWATYDAFCNACGNCDVFCPETGGPYLVKPRFFSTRERYDEAGRAGVDGLLVEAGRIRGRFEGREHVLERGAAEEVFGDGVVTARLDPATGAVREATAAPGAPPGHRLRTGVRHALRALHDGVLAGVNPVSAAAPAAAR